MPIYPVEPFVPGLKLSQMLYEQAVRPIMAAHFPRLVYSAARLGYGSDVLGFDTPRSTDHGWGPKLDLFVPEADYTDYVFWFFKPYRRFTMLSHFLSAGDLSRPAAEALLKRAQALKAEWQRGSHSPLPLQGKTLALVFEKPSLRTRVAFEAGMTQLGGHGSYLSANDIDMGGRESVPDVARNLSRWVQAIAARVFKHSTIEDLARYATVPVINALSDREHPCQALADMLTLLERYGRLQGLRLAYVGDGNNVCHSLLLLGATLGVHVGVACPPDYRPDPEILELAERCAAECGGAIAISATPGEVVEGADAVYTDVWASMGQEHEAARRRPVFQPYQVNAALLALARPDALAMHCLPAHRGEEITAEVIDGPHSVVFDQAENRLHMQKALILTLLGL